MRKLFLLIILAFLLCGCAVGLSNIKKDYSPELAPGKNIAIGKVYVRGFRNIYKQVLLTFVKKDDKKNYNIRVNESTYWKRLFPNDKEAALYFFVEMPSGEYELKQVIVAGLVVYPAGFKFSLPKEKGVYYIGTLEIIKSGETNVWTLQTPVDIYVVDEYEEALKEFKARYPHIKEEIKVDLIEYGS